MSTVIREVKKAKREIVATMLLREERENPLPNSYHTLLKKKLKEGIRIKRLGFGTKEDYNKIVKKIGVSKGNYLFKYIKEKNRYQRLIIIDQKKLFFGTNGLFFQSDYGPLIKVFLDYFTENFNKGKHE